MLDTLCCWSGCFSTSIVLPCDIAVHSSHAKSPTCCSEEDKNFNNIKEYIHFFKRSKNRSRLKNEKNNIINFSEREAFENNLIIGSSKIKVTNKDANIGKNEYAEILNIENNIRSLSSSSSSKNVCEEDSSNIENRMRDEQKGGMNNVRTVMRITIAFKVGDFIEEKILNIARKHGMTYLMAKRLINVFTECILECIKHFVPPFTFCNCASLNLLSYNTPAVIDCACSSFEAEIENSKYNDECTSEDKTFYRYSEEAGRAETFGKSDNKINKFNGYEEQLKLRTFINEYDAKVLSNCINCWKDILFDSVYSFVCFDFTLSSAIQRYRTLLNTLLNKNNFFISKLPSFFPFTLTSSHLNSFDDLLKYTQVDERNLVQYVTSHKDKSFPSSSYSFFLPILFSSVYPNSESFSNTCCEDSLNCINIPIKNKFTYSIAYWCAYDALQLHFPHAAMTLRQLEDSYSNAVLDLKKSAQYAISSLQERQELEMEMALRQEAADIEQNKKQMAAFVKNAKGKNNKAANSSDGSNNLIICSNSGGSHKREEEELPPQEAEGQEMEEDEEENKDVGTSINVAALVNQHVAELEALERHWNAERRSLRERQLEDFRKLVFDLYEIEIKGKHCDQQNLLSLPPLPCAIENVDLKQWTLFKRGGGGGGGGLGEGGEGGGGGGRGGEGGGGGGGGRGGGGRGGRGAIEGNREEHLLDAHGFNFLCKNDGKKSLSKAAPHSGSGLLNLLRTSNTSEGVICKSVNSTNTMGLPYFAAPVPARHAALSLITPTNVLRRISAFQNKNKANLVSSGAFFGGLRGNGVNANSSVGDGMKSLRKTKHSILNDSYSSSRFLPSFWFCVYDEDVLEAEARDDEEKEEEEEDQDDLNFASNDVSRGKGTLKEYVLIKVAFGDQKKRKYIIRVLQGNFLDLFTQVDSVKAGSSNSNVVSSSFNLKKRNLNVSSKTSSNRKNEHASVVATAVKNERVNFAESCFAKSYKYEYSPYPEEMDFLLPFRKGYWHNTCCCSYFESYNNNKTDAQKIFTAAEESSKKDETYPGRSNIAKHVVYFDPAKNKMDATETNRWQKKSAAAATATLEENSISRFRENAEKANEISRGRNEQNNVCIANRSQRSALHKTSNKNEKNTYYYSNKIDETATMLNQLEYFKLNNDNNNNSINNNNYNDIFNNKNDINKTNNNNYNDIVNNKNDINKINNNNNHYINKVNNDNHHINKISNDNHHINKINNDNISKTNNKHDFTELTHDLYNNSNNKSDIIHAPKSSSYSLHSSSFPCASSDDGSSTSSNATNLISSFMCDGLSSRKHCEPAQSTLASNIFPQYPFSSSFSNSKSIYRNKQTPDSTLRGFPPVPTSRTSNREFVSHTSHASSCCCSFKTSFLNKSSKSPMNSLIGLVFPTVSNLKLDSLLYKQLFHLCESFTDFVLPSFSEQLHAIHKLHKLNPLKLGDYFVTRHMNINIGNIACNKKKSSGSAPGIMHKHRGLIIFHIIVPPDTDDIVPDAVNQILQTCLKRIFKVADTCGISHLTIPLLLMDNSYSAESTYPFLLLQKRIHNNLRFIKSSIHGLTDNSSENYDLGGGTTGSLKYINLVLPHSYASITPFGGTEADTSAASFHSLNSIAQSTVNYIKSSMSCY